MAGSNRIPITGKPGGSGHTTHLERSQFENGCLFLLFFLKATNALEGAQCHGEGMSLRERRDIRQLSQAQALGEKACAQDCTNMLRIRWRSLYPITDLLLAGRS